MTNDSDRPFIVAGVDDGSRFTLEALLLAAQQAELTGAELHVMMAWTLPEI